jgi:hypothetical protein
MFPVLKCSFLFVSKKETLLLFFLKSYSPERHLRRFFFNLESKKLRFMQNLASMEEKFTEILKKLILANTAVRLHL